MCPAAAVMLFANGMTQAMIANMFGCSQNAVSHALRKRNVSTRRGPRPDIAKRERAVEMAGAGKSYYEIADALQVSHATVSNWARAAGIVRGKGGGCVARNNAARSSKAAPKRMARVRDAIGERFEVVRETRKDWFLLRCRECGHEFERFVDLHYPTTCPECQRREAEANAERRAQERDDHAKAREILRGFSRFLKFKQEEAEFEAWLDKKHECKECGRIFTMRELREENPWNFSSNPTFCSTKCARRFHKRNGNYKRRLAREQTCSDSVSLHALCERDDGVCHLCGKKVDPSDFRYADGVFVAGALYPSIDHVVPLSKGGSHTWGNVKLAHFRCNAVKSDGSIDDARRRLARKGVA